MPKSSAIIARRRVAAGNAERGPEALEAGRRGRGPRPNCVTLRFLAQPQDVNFGGKVHGGSVMRWIDQAGFACAAGWSGGYCVTVYVGGIRFVKPIRIAQLVEVEARVILTGRTSMHLAVEVAAIDIASGQRTETSQCVIVFVAVDAQGEPRAVPAWVPRTRLERAWATYAERLAAVREAMEVELQASKPKAGAGKDLATA
jgi:acyl-CoA hydrolase